MLARLPERRASDPAVQDVSPAEQISDLACAVAELHQMPVRSGREGLLVPARVCVHCVQPGYVGTFMHVLP